MEEEEGKERREVRGHCYALITRTPSNPLNRV
jgi:hypothetical protein